MSDEFLDWVDIESEIDDLNEVVTAVDQYTDTSAGESHQSPLKARQKLELYWEHKRLEENLYDVLSDTRQMDANLRDELARANTLA